MSWSWERFWDVMESYSILWVSLAVVDVLFGLLAVVSLLLIPFDMSNPSVVVAVIDLIIVAVVLLPLSYVLVRIRQRQGH